MSERRCKTMPNRVAQYWPPLAAQTHHDASASIGQAYQRAPAAQPMTATASFQQEKFQRWE